MNHSVLSSAKVLIGRTPSSARSWGFSVNRKAFLRVMPLDCGQLHFRLSGTEPELEAERKSDSSVCILGDNYSSRCWSSNRPLIPCRIFARTAH